MQISIATWNLNTWINKARKRISNEQLWTWACTNLAADLYVFTEAQTPPPSALKEQGWSWVHRPGGIPGVSKWGTVIAVNRRSGLSIEHITCTGPASTYVVDQAFPGSLTAARVRVADRVLATVVGLYLPYRKDEKKNFIGHPIYDLSEMRGDINALTETEQVPLIVAGDLNYEYLDVPPSLQRIGSHDNELVDPFKSRQLLTYEQEWGNRKRFKLDYIYLSQSLAKNAVSQRGGIQDFPTSLQVSDHAPLLVTLSITHAE